MKLITDFEEIQKRPDFDTEASIWTDNFAELIAPYRFSEERECQIRKPDRWCKTKHMYGWLARTTEGKEVLVGRVCSRKQFKGDHNFKQEIARVQKATRITGYIDKISAAIKEKESITSKLLNARTKLQAWKTKVEYYQDEIPEKLLLNLQRNSDQGIASVKIQYLYEETDEKGKTTKEWVDQTIGRIVGLNVIHNTYFSVHQREIKTVLDALRETCESGAKEESGETKLRNWAKSLSDWQALIQKTDSLCDNAQRFCDSKNLMQLLFTTKNHNVRYELAKLAICAERGGTYCSDADAKKFILDLDRSYRKKNSGRNFRILEF